MGGALAVQVPIGLSRKVQWFDQLKGVLVDLHHHGASHGWQWEGHGELFPDHPNLFTSVLAHEPPSRVGLFMGRLD